MLSKKYNVIDRNISDCGKIHQKIDIIVQHTNPRKWEYMGEEYVHVGVLESRCQTWNAINWQERFGLMDKVISTNIIFGDEVIMPISTNSEKYFSNTGKVERFTNNFTFYTYGTPDRINNLSAIIKAFHLEFRVSEPVDLVISVKINPSETKAFCNSIKSTMRIFKDLSQYREEIITNNENIHLQCDAFIGASYSGYWDFPAFDALCYGKTPIVNNCLGYHFINDSNGYPVKNTLEPSFGIKSEYFDLDTSYALWHSIDVLDLMAQMRKCYSENRESKIEKSVEDTLCYDRSRILPMWEKVIENARRRKATKEEEKENLST